MSNPLLIAAAGNWSDLVHHILHPFDLFTIPLNDWINAVVDYVVNHFRPIFQVIRIPVSWLLRTLQSSLIALPPTILLLLLGLVAWQLAGWRIGLFALLSLTGIGFVGAWEQAMTSLSLVVTAVAFCLVIGIPVGIACARSDRLLKFTQPLLDAMQTIPTFVYLVPVVMLFGIGEVPGIIATIVYALPPLIRLTNLGIRQVSTDVIEAAVAFGSTPTQVLIEVQLPLAMPTIMAGVNQTVLFALGMSVITAMIAVPGLGLMVLQGVGRLDVGTAAVGGLGIVVLAIALDRITQTLGHTEELATIRQRGLIGLVSRLNH